MRVDASINKNLYFKANIIDCHIHRGAENSIWNSIKFPTDRVDEFIKSPLNISVSGHNQTDYVKKVLVSGIDGLAWSEKQKQEVFAQEKSKFSLKPEEVEFAKDEIATNMDMINKYKKDKFYAVMAVCQPSKTNGYADNIKKIFNENPGTIFGLKFHPQDLLLNANSKLYDNYLEFAEANKLPCLFHSQVNIDYTLKQEKSILNWADPQYIYELAKRHPKVPVVMAHMGAGGDVAHKKAIRVLEESLQKNDANLYVDISWVDFPNDLPAKNPENVLDVIEKMKKYNKLDRILFGTDAPLGCYGETAALERTALSPKEAYELTVSRLKTAIKNKFGQEADSIIDKIFYQNAADLFFEKKNLKGASKTKMIIIGSSIVAAGSLMLFTHQR